MNSVNLGNTLVIGDSYSTFAGYVPEGYDVWYNTTVHPDNKVLDVDKTWWQRIFKKVDGHPTDRGMNDIAEGLYAYLIK